MNNQYRNQNELANRFSADLPPELIQNSYSGSPAEISENISSNAAYQRPEAAQTVNPAGFNPAQAVIKYEINKVNQAAANEINNIQNMVNSGAVSYEQGHILMDYVAKKAFDIVQHYNQKIASTPAPQTFDFRQTEIALENPEFFNEDGRNQVLEYLKSTNAPYGKDEMSQITNLITGVEDSAIKRYLSKLEHEKALNDENEAAKLRLNANAQKSAAGDMEPVFTREKIGKMSGAEFAKNERLIMEQLRKGLIH